MRATDTDPQALGPVLKKHREKLKMKQADLASAAGCQAGMISMIENGERRPSDALLSKLADALRTTATSLRDEAQAQARRPDGPLDDRDSSETEKRSHWQPTALQAARIAKLNKERVDRLNQEAAALQQQATSTINTLIAQRAVVIADFLEPAFAQVSRVRGIPRNTRVTLGSAITADTSNGQEFRDNEIEVRDRLRDNIVGYVGASAAGAGVGAAAALYGAVAMWATSSTGAAIAGLSGAEATSATFAWLGGGSLAAGGLGIAGGTAVLTGVIAAPVLLAAGVAASVKGRSLRKQAQAESEALSKIEAAFDYQRKHVMTWLDWAQRATTILLIASLRGAALIPSEELHTTIANTDATFDYDDLEEIEKKHLNRVIDLMTIVLRVLGLPILPQTEDETFYPAEFPTRIEAALTGALEVAAAPDES